MGTFPPPALRTRRADFRHRALQWNHAARTRAFRLRPAGGSCEPGHPAHTLALAGRCIVRPVDALTTATARVVPFAYACDDVWHSCSFIGVIGRSATPGACSLSPSLPPEAPSLGRHCPASTVVRASPPPWPARPCPHGSSVGACHAAGRASVLRPFPSSTRAAAITPAEPVGARVARFPTAGSLPRNPGGSASALPVSRPARRSIALRPTWSLNRPGRPFVVGVLQPMSLPPSSAPTATGWSDSCRAGFAPAEEWRRVTAHWSMLAMTYNSSGDRSVGTDF